MSSIWRESQTDLVMVGTWEWMVMLSNWEEQLGRERVDVCKVQWLCQGEWCLLL